MYYMCRFNDNCCSFILNRIKSSKIMWSNGSIVSSWLNARNFNITNFGSRLVVRLVKIIIMINYLIYTHPMFPFIKRYKKIFNFYFPGTETDWPLLVSAYTWLSLMVFIVLPLLPESPKYLYQVVKEEDRALQGSYIKIWRYFNLFSKKFFKKILIFDNYFM